MTRALVTGAGKRLGRAIALELATQGYDVGVHYASSSGGATEVVQEIEAMGRNAVALRADLLNEAEVETLIPRAAEVLGGPIHVLVNNASIFEHDDMNSATRATWDRHFESNLRAPFVLTQALARQVPEPIEDEHGEPEAQAPIRTHQSNSTSSHKTKSNPKANHTTKLPTHSITLRNHAHHRSLRPHRLQQRLCPSPIGKCMIHCSFSGRSLSRHLC